MLPENSFFIKAGLLDRLTPGNGENHFDGLRDAGAEAGMSEQRYRNAVLRDLEWLFNAAGPLTLTKAELQRKYPHAVQSVLGYGLRGILGQIVNNEAELQRKVLETLRLFEPRLEVREMALEITEEGRLIEIRIEGVLLIENASKNLWIRTDLSTLTSSLRTQRDG